jgi:hypothetical protein
MSVTFFDPVAECLVPARPYTLSIDLKKPVTIALVINKIVDCDVLMHHVGEALVGLRPNIVLKPYETGNITFADSALIDQIADECDAAVCAIGHCGSCTAGTVKDGVALIERGIPAVSLITEIFWEQGNALSRSLGWPDAPRVELPYPIWGTGNDNMRQVAEKTARELLPVLEEKHVSAA